MATETWVLNDVLSDSSVSFDVDFVSNNVSYFRIGRNFESSGGSITTNELIYFEKTSTFPLPNFAYFDGSWADNLYRTITFATAPTGDLLAWLQANGTKQGGVQL